MNIKIDLKDRKILYELDKDSRQSNKEIARKVGLSEQVVGNRIKRLIDLGVVEYFLVKINPSLLGYMHIKTYLRLHNITKNKENELIHNLNQQKNIFWLASLRGKYDIEMSIHVKNIADFSKRYDELFNHWKDYILERNVVMLEKAFTYTKTYLVPTQKPEEIVYSLGTGEPVKLDNTNAELLKVLNKEGRKPLIEIAQRLKVSSDTVRYRIKNLKKSGVITGFGAKIDSAKLNMSYYIISLKLQNMTVEKYKKLETFSKLNKNVLSL